MLENLDAQIRYMIYGTEIGVLGTLHYQGYVEWKAPKRLSGVRKVLERAHWEPRRGTRVEARNYCMKDGEYLEFGAWDQEQQGARNDLHDICLRIAEGDDYLALANYDNRVLAKYPKFILNWTAAYEKQVTQNFREVFVEVIWGPAGTGKTRSVHDREDNVFTVNTDEAFPFDGYEGEQAILLDDFYGGIKYHNLLRILDGHQYRVNVKGGHRYACWRRVYITSNTPPEGWYNMGMTPALERRINLVTVTEVVR